MHFIKTFAPENQIIHSHLIIKFCFAEVWIIGDSIVRRGGYYAHDLVCEQLSQSRYQILWDGSGSMRWKHLLPRILSIFIQYSAHPCWYGATFYLNYFGITTIPKTQKLNLKAKRMNRVAHQYMTDFGLGKVFTPRILWYMTELFDNDVVHLSDFGKLTYVQTFKNLTTKIIEESKQSNFVKSIKAL